MNVQRVNLPFFPDDATFLFSSLSIQPQWHEGRLPSTLTEGALPHENTFFMFDVSHYGAMEVCHCDRRSTSKFIECSCSPNVQFLFLNVKNTHTRKSSLSTLPKTNNTLTPTSAVLFIQSEKKFDSKRSHLLTIEGRRDAMETRGRKKGAKNKEGHSAGGFHDGSGAKTEKTKLQPTLNPHDKHEEAARMLHKLVVEMAHCLLVMLTHTHCIDSRITRCKDHNHGYPWFHCVVDRAQICMQQMRNTVVCLKHVNASQFKPIRDFCFCWHWPIVLLQQTCCLEWQKTAMSKEICCLWQNKWN